MRTLNLTKAEIRVLIKRYQLIIDRARLDALDAPDFNSKRIAFDRASKALTRLQYFKSSL
jgi:hypothetical protein